MTQEQFDRERKYRAALSLAKEMLKNNTITPEDFSKMKSFFIEKFNPPLGSIA